jgi:hypothetical protein
LTRSRHRSYQLRARRFEGAMQQRPSRVTFFA